MEPHPVQVRRVRPQNVLFATHVLPDPHTAVYRNTCDRAAYLESLGHHCTIVTPSDFPWLTRTSPRLIPLLFPIAVARFLSNERRRFDTAVFHSHAGWAVSLLRRYLGKHRRLKTAVSFHGLEPLYFSRLHQHQPTSFRHRFFHDRVMHRLLQSACRQSDMLFCLNSDEQQYLVLNEWTSRDRVALIPHPASSDFFIQRNYADRALSLLFVGQWLPMKGIHYLVEAFTRLNREHRELRLGCIGTLASKSTVLDAFPADVRPHVTVRERVTSREILQFHRHADLFILPTLSEGFSLALAEAMASGLPIVTTPIGGAPDYLRHRSSAIFVPVGEAGAIVTAIDRLIDDRPRRELLGRAARQAAEHLRPEEIWEDYGRYFEQLGEGPNPAEEPST